MDKTIDLDNLTDKEQESSSDTDLEIKPKKEKIYNTI